MFIFLLFYFFTFLLFYFYIFVFFYYLDHQIIFFEYNPKNNSLIRFNIFLGNSTGVISKNKNKIDEKTRLLLFIPSISVSEHIRNSIDDFRSVQNKFLSIVYLLIDPSLYILYVTPVHFSSEDIELHEKLLLQLNIDISGKYGKRLNFIFPECLRRLPKKMNLSQILLYSSSAIKKIKNCIKKFSNVFYLPCSTSFSIAEKKLSILLNIPFLSAEPTFCQKVSSISFMKKVIICFFHYIFLI